MKTETKTLTTFVIAGIVLGIISWAVGKFVLGNVSNYIALALAIVTLAVIPKAMKGVLNVNQKFNWWLANGGWLYVFIWFITWIILINL